MGTDPELCPVMNFEQGFRRDGLAGAGRPYNLPWYHFKMVQTTIGWGTYRDRCASEPFAGIKATCFEGFQSCLIQTKRSQLGPDLGNRLFG